MGGRAVRRRRRRPHGELLPHGADELPGRLQGPLDAGRGDLELVAATAEILEVEPARQLLGDGRDRVEVEGPLAVDDDAEHGPAAFATERNLHQLQSGALDHRARERLRVHARPSLS